MADYDDSDVPETGAVFTFGKSKFSENLPNKFWVKNDRVVQVACGDEHTAVLAESGRVFMFGPNDWGQLGIGEQKVANKPMCIKSLKPENSKLVACGRSHTLIATESGSIYTFGANGEGQLGVEDISDSHTPVCVDTLDRAAWRMLAAGCDHSVALTEDGQVYVWGDNGCGQLGLGDRSQVPVPTHLNIGLPITSIACGYYHTALVTANGDLYVCGENDEGKLGLGDDAEDSNTPQCVTTITDRVKTVACGGSHTVALTENGKVYTFGSGASGQLGLGPSELESHSPTLLQLPFAVSQVCCGENFTALISENGQLYTFGDGRHGKLGLHPTNHADQFTPRRVDRFVNFVVRQVACGGCHMIVRAAPRSITTAADKESLMVVMDRIPVGDNDRSNVSGNSSAQNNRREKLKMWERHKVELKETNSETEETSKNTAEESEHRREVTVEDRVKKKKPMPPRKKHSKLCLVL